MAKNFSVEWLSQSFHTSSTARDLESAKDAAIGFLKPHVPCVVQPRPPTFYKGVSVEPKVRQKTSFHTDKEDDLKEATDVYTPASPTSKCCVYRICVHYCVNRSSGDFPFQHYSYRLTLLFYILDSCGYTSCSESEVGDDSEGETAALRRMRTKFTSDQIYRLEKTFNKHKYLGATQRRKMAERLHLSETQVKTWFQNRRMKLKREVQDLRAEYFAPAMLCATAFPPTASLQHHGFAGQRVPLAQAAHTLYPRLIQQFPAQQMAPSQMTHPMLLAPHYYAQL
ncbi:hypothetical protein AAFF_G00137200 [Aldrovandia affinis]|uniref:Homeobox domain-containing protein n=1 Tax=Aldrovandia affinis TaxID=143900 RepID=A0AAD7TD66_9TELE|nr:hypothetical protein AAFF_G00137200 [Aldrovandia affinis]